MVNKISVKLLNLTYLDSVYVPAEDSFLFAESISDNIKKNQSVLEIGCGTGYVCLQLAQFANSIIAVDINPEAVLLTKQNSKLNNIKNIQTFKSDLFSKIKVNEKFDVVIFNPPYLPDESIKSKNMLDKALVSGDTGREVLFLFLERVKFHLNKKGCVYFLISSYTGQNEVEKKLTQEGFFFNIIASKKLFFETLFVYRAYFEKLNKTGDL